MALTKAIGEGVGTLAGDTTTLTLEDTSSHSANTGPAISFKSKDSDGTTREVAKIVGESHSGSNEGNLAFQTRNGGTLETKWKIFKNGNMIPSNSAYGMYLGTTSVSDSNLLDDYEEGTATLAFSSSGSTFQYSYQIAFYTKVGRNVHLVCYMQLDGGGNSFTSNTLSITGLPFTSINNAGHQATTACRLRFVNLGSSFSYLMATVGSNTTDVGLLQIGDNVAPGTIGANGLSSSSGQVMFSLSYVAA